MPMMGAPRLPLHYLVSGILVCGVIHADDGGSPSAASLPGIWHTCMWGYSCGPKNFTLKSRFSMYRTRLAMERCGSICQKQFFVYVPLLVIVSVFCLAIFCISLLHVHFISVCAFSKTRFISTCSDWHTVLRRGFAL